MRLMSLSTILVPALAAVLSLATGCKSDKSKAATDKAADPAAATGGAAGDEAAEQAPGLPVPRRMRGSETAGDAGPGTGRWRERRGEEMRQRRDDLRKRFDADGNGQLDDDERAAMRHERLQRQIARIDADGDGKISRDEAEAVPFGARLLGDFDVADANQDSFISPEELEAAMSERESRRMESWRQRHPEQGAEPAPP